MRRDIAHPRWALAYLAAGLGLVPWIVAIATGSDDDHAGGRWPWVVLDSVEAVVLVSTGLALRRNNELAPALCLACAGLLTADAAADIATARDRTRAVHMAAVAGAASVLCLYTAFRSRQPLVT